MKCVSFFLAISTLCLFGCVSPQQLSLEADRVGYGAPLTLEYETVIKSFMETRLKDASSAIYKFEAPQKFWISKPPVQGGGLEVTGWGVPVLINAKNSYGGYVGFVRYTFIFRDNRLIKWQGENRLWMNP